MLFSSFSAFTPFILLKMRRAKLKNNFIIYFRALLFNPMSIRDYSSYFLFETSLIFREILVSRQTKNVNSNVATCQLLKGIRHEFTNPFLYQNFLNQVLGCSGGVVGGHRKKRKQSRKWRIPWVRDMTFWFSHSNNQYSLQKITSEENASFPFFFLVREINPLGAWLAAVYHNFRSHVSLTLLFVRLMRQSRSYPFSKSMKSILPGKTDGKLLPCCWMSSFIVSVIRHSRNR